MSVALRIVVAFLLLTVLGPSGQASELESELRERVAAGEIDAYYRLGLLLDGTEEGARFLMKAAWDGHRGARCRLAYLAGGFSENAFVEREMERHTKLALDGQPDSLGWIHIVADAGSARDQWLLASLYSGIGGGLKKDYPKAFEYLLRSARQSWLPAMHDLGVAYFHGRGAPRDFVLAYMWFNLAAAGGLDETAAAAAGLDDTAGAKRDLVATLMTLSQIEEAQRRSRDWEPDFSEVGHCEKDKRNP